MTTSSYSIAAGRDLTPRMLDVLRAAAAGKTAKGTALELGVTEATVKTIRAALCERLGASNMASAIGEAARRGKL